jgi:serine/threonine protein kinase/Tol biopolymer transport system component
MSLTPGSRLGPYVVVARIGAGAVGEVYRATDSRLHRDVAIKVLRAAFDNPERLRRFQMEARVAGSLNHPNILAIYDIGTHDGYPYIISELLEGESLDIRLRNGKISPSKSLEYAQQIAAGLAAAHAKSVIHRDIKPGNLFITKDGRVKILDFGLAKIAPAAMNPDDQTLTSSETSPGTLIGTPAYMSPEQVRGLPADHRSDIFSFGCVLYEMLSGQRPFRGTTIADTVSAILTQQPPPLSLSDPNIPLAVESIVHHCLKKNPEDRFQSVSDFIFAVQTLTLTSTSSMAGIPVPAPVISNRQIVKWVLPAAMLVAGILGAWFFIPRDRPAAPDFHRLTFRRGRIHSARFTPDGKEVIYSAQWETDRSELFSVRLDIPGSRSLGFPNAELRAVSASGELLLSLNPMIEANAYGPAGTLARAPLSGGAPRSIQERVDFAAWSPDGKDLAVVVETDQGTQLEYPSGKLLYRTAGYISSPRVASDGKSIAFLDHPTSNNSGGSVAVIDTAGRKKSLTQLFSNADGLAWSAKGDEIWFTASETGSRSELWAVTLSGKLRRVFNESVGLVLHDISKDGRVLITNLEQRTKLLFRAPGDKEDRDLSWLDWSLVTGLSPDGRQVVFSESGEGAGAHTLSFIRGASGTPPVLLGAGSFPLLSPDGQYVVAFERNPSGILVYPVGTGQPKRLQMTGYTINRAGMLPDNKGIWFNASEPQRKPRFYLTNMAGEKPRPFAAEGVLATFPGLTPDGKYLSGLSGAKLLLYPLDGGEPQVPIGLREGERIAGGTTDGKWFFVFARNQMPTKIWKLEWRTGRRELLTDVTSTERAGMMGINTMMVVPNGSTYTYAYSLPQHLSELHCVEGLK